MQAGTALQPPTGSRWRPATASTIRRDIVGNNLVKEVRGGFSYYYARHVLKWQTDFGQVETADGARQGNPKLFEVRSQLQFIF